ncbi:glycosyltransferase family 2 protein [Parabacteroides sp. PF5-9]|uniref:glycosyltransferase family 2 protein n=1 Tax=Parabacteroides sp. PF5-9 TaxID=1742404 RepID=UPI0024733199|nr:glycosyltransferase family 2 protein [Parabacteroides sp. PF5-9]MDH6358706.1 GT2 family glycosyltransferase [Parabacteroides sp. PF5-9]
MDVSIIYVNYKTSRLIIDSIESVKKHTDGITYEIIVVDNHSQDDSFVEISQSHPDVIYISSPENLGFGRANNLGIERAQGECLFFLNPDTLLQNNAIHLLYDFITSNEKVGACGGNLVDTEMQPTSSFGRLFPSLFQEFISIFNLRPVFLKHTKSTYYNFTGKKLSVASIVGADLMVRKEVLAVTGGFDPDFFMNFEETELCYRIKKAGYDIVSVPNAQIIHFEGKSSYVSSSRKQLFYNGKYIYFKKVYGSGSLFWLYFFELLKCYSRKILFSLFMNKEKRAYWTEHFVINKNAFLTQKS